MRKHNLKSLAVIALVSALTAFICFVAFGRFFNNHQDVYLNTNPVKVHDASYDSNASGSGGPVNLEDAASIVIPVTVHIDTKVPPQKINSGQGNNSPFGGFFGGGGDDPFSQLFGGGGQYYSPGKLASGSGVIISSDGYIVTNNHVIDGASKIIVTLYNDKSYDAKVVGADPNTDLAVLKIDATNLPYIVFANSNNVKIGQWVLACGYPLNLQTTVTAGIISATSRNLGVNDEGTNPIDSYLQTDAAVNPGNSGGPLVNTEGKLVGLNSAIATPTGSFAGYAYAIPSNIVRKVTNDILKFGTVQRAFLGVYLPGNQQNNGWNVSFTPNNNAIPGFKVIGTVPNGAAADAGIEKGDIITGLDNVPINSEADLLGAIASHRPGDRVAITYVRDDKTHTAEVTLKNKNGTTGIVKATIMDELGVGLMTLPNDAAQKMGIKGGVVVTSIGSGLIKSQTDMQRSFIIVRAGDYPVTTVEQLQSALEKQGNNVVLQGFYWNQQGMYNYAITDLKSGIVN